MSRISSIRVNRNKCSLSKYDQKNVLGRPKIWVRSYMLSRGEGVLGEISINKVLMWEKYKVVKGLDLFIELWFQIRNSRDSKTQSEHYPIQCQPRLTDWVSRLLYRELFIQEDKTLVWKEDKPQLQGTKYKRHWTDSTILYALWTRNLKWSASVELLCLYCQD